jgi:hypothetical protein
MRGRTALGFFAGFVALAACTDFNGLTVPEPDSDASLPPDSAVRADVMVEDADTPSETGDGGAGSNCSGAHVYFNSVSGRCYRFVAARAAWEAAEADCVGWGGHLASITSPEEHDFVKDLVLRELPDAGAGDGVWIGLNDRATEGAWVWSSGEAFGFDAFATGEPGLNDPDRNCVFQYGPVHKGTWDDFKCLVAGEYVCER